MATRKIVPASMLGSNIDQPRRHPLPANHILVVAHAHPSDMSDYLLSVNSLPFDGGLGKITSSGESPNSVALILLTTTT